MCSEIYLDSVLFGIVDINIFPIRLVQIRQSAWNKAKTMYTFESKEVLRSRLDPPN
jgi:hypothetical protein